MPSETRETLRLKLNNLGEEAPSHWTVLQIRGRISELHASSGTGRKTGNPTQMQQLNKAARKKSEIVAFAESLQAPVNANMTIAQLYAATEKHIKMNTVAQAWDTVDFGKHSKCTYLDIKMHHQSYTEWAMTTHKENPEANWRLQRLALWLEEHWDQPAPHPAPKKIATPKKTSRTRASKMFTESQAQSSDGNTTDSFSLVNEQPSELARLKEEMAQLKAENAALSLQQDRAKSRKEM